MNFVHTYNPTPNPGTYAYYKAYIVIILNQPDEFTRCLENDLTLGQLVWKPRTADCSNYVVIDSYPETRVFDKDHQDRSQFWSRMLKEEIKLVQNY